MNPFLEILGIAIGVSLLTNYLRRRIMSPADMAKMAADPETQRWWKETDPCQIPLPEARAKGKIWTMAEEVFYTP